MKKGQAVLITTEYRGVFFGHVKDSSKLPDEITLTEARNCLYWSTDIGGFLGLASIGPSKECRIGTQVKQLTLYKVSSVTLIEKQAEAKWLTA